MNPTIKLIITSAALLLMTLTLSTSAYLTAADSKSNDFTIGVNTIGIEEPNFDSSGVVVSEGTSFLKDPCVYVSEGVDCYVRVYCEFDNSMAEDYVSMNINTTDWIKGTDGFYYYKNKLSAHESSTPLFTEVEIAGDGEHTYTARDFDIIVYAESCQAYKAGNTLSENAYFDNYTAAWNYWNQAKEAID